MRNWEIATCWGSFRLFYSLISIISLEESSNPKFLNLSLYAMKFLFRLNPELYIVVHCQYVFLEVHFLTNPVLHARLYFVLGTCKGRFWGTLSWSLLSSCRFLLWKFYKHNNLFLLDWLLFQVFGFGEGHLLVFGFVDFF